MDPDISISQQRADMFIGNPESLFSACSRVIQYFRKLEENLTTNQDINSLTSLGGMPGLPQEVTSLEKILPSIISGGRQTKTDAYITLIALEEKQKYFQDLFSDFEPEYDPIKL